MTRSERRTTLSWLTRSLSLVLVFALLSATTAEAQRRRRRRTDTQTTEAPQEAPQTPPAETGPTLSDADRAQARALFQAGAAAVDAGRWADAIESFRAAYALTHAPSALFNTGYALRALGRYRESLAAFTELLALPNVADAMRTQTEELSTEVRGRIALIRLQGLDSELRYGVRLDGVALEDGGDRPLPVQADPGPRTLDVILEGYETFTWSGQLGDGQATDVLVELTPLRVAGGSVVDEAWFWALIGGLVLVGGGLAAYFIADDAAQLKPNQPLVIHY